jgi:hypothetical protein
LPVVPLLRSCFSTLSLLLPTGRSYGTSSAFPIYKTFCYCGVYNQPRHQCHLIKKILTPAGHKEVKFQKIAFLLYKNCRSGGMGIKLQPGCWPAPSLKSKNFNIAAAAGVTSLKIKENVDGATPLKPHLCSITAWLQNSSYRTIFRCSG